MCKKNKEIKKESKGPGTHARLSGPDLIFFFFFFQGGEPPLIFLEKKK
jgi:hypothetical protein